MAFVSGSLIVFVLPDVADVVAKNSSVAAVGAVVGVDGVGGPMRMRTPKSHGTRWARAGADGSCVVSMVLRLCCP